MATERLRPKRSAAPPKHHERFISTAAALLKTPMKAFSRPDSITEPVEESGNDSQPEVLNLQLPASPASPPSPPSLATQISEFRGLLDEQKDHNRQLQAQITDLKSFKNQVADELKAELRQLCAELQQKNWKELELQVERKVSEKVAPLQEELAVVKVEMQQMRERMKSSPPNTSQQQTQPDVSKLEDKVHRLDARVL